MNTQITRTQIVIPRRHSNLLTRSRLIEALNHLIDKKLIIIVAPAGYGKTSLMIDFVHQVGVPVCWYSLSPFDQDLRRFLSHFVSAIVQRFPALGRQASTILQNMNEHLGDLDDLSTLLINAIDACTCEDFLLVLDDYQFIAGDPEINHFINRFVQQIGDNYHLCILSRTLMNLPDLSLMVARSQVAGLNAAKLAFRADEFQSLIWQNYQIVVPEAEAEAIVRKTEGWITGLLLSTHIVKDLGIVEQAELMRSAGIDLYDYLAQQVFLQQPEAVQTFLLRTSFFEEFNSQLCRTVFADVDTSDTLMWDDLIDYVLHNNLFVLSTENDGTWLCYHQLFRTFLQEQFVKERPEEATMVRRRLASVYTNSGEFEKAFHIYQDLGDEEAIADLIEQSGSGLVASGQFNQLARWIDKLPRQQVEMRPELLSLRGIAATTQGDMEIGLSLLNQAAEMLEAAGNLPALARTLSRRASALVFLGNYQKGLQDANKALSITKPVTEATAVRAEALKIKGQCLSHIGDAHAAIAFTKRARAHYRRLGKAQNVAGCDMDLGIFYRSIGAFNQAHRAYHKALRYWKLSNDVMRQAILYNNIGVLYHRQGNYEQAKAAFEEAILYARQVNYKRAEALILSSVGDLYADLDAPQVAKTAYTQAYKIAQRLNHHFLLFYLKLAQGELARREGDFAQSWTLLARAEQFIEERQKNYELGLYQYALGKLHLAEGRSRQAIRYLQEAEHCFEKGGQQVERAHANLYLARVQYDEENREEAVASLERAFNLAAKLDSQHALVVPGRQVQTFLQAVTDQPSLDYWTQQLQQQIRQFERNLPSIRRRLRQVASHLPSSPPELTIFSLGQVQVEKGGQALTNKDWKTKLSRDLFFCLLAHPEGLHKDVLSEMFWPESQPDQLKFNLKKALYNLRKAVGKDMLLFKEGYYQFNWDADYEYDVETFWNQIDRAQKAPDRRRRLAAYEAACTLYNGPYLPNVEGTWVYSPREQIWQAFREAALALGRHNLETGNFCEALNYSNQILSEDLYVEEAHRLAMRAHAFMGNRAAVVRQFELCQKVLAEHLDVSPAPETQALYTKLLQS